MKSSIKLDIYYNLLFDNDGIIQVCFSGLVKYFEIPYTVQSVIITMSSRSDPGYSYKIVESKNDRSIFIKTDFGKEQPIMYNSFESWVRRNLSKGLSHISVNYRI